MIKALYEKFQPWSDGGSVWLISDPHFNDSDCKHMDPNWPEPKEYVKGINECIYKNDTLICLGDCGDPKYFDWIKCRYKVLITGNHDSGTTKYKKYFDEVYNGPLIIAQKIILSHEPVFVPWAVNIHGHNHEGVLIKNHINIAANVVNYKPINLKDVIKSGVLNQVDSIHRITIEIASNKGEKNGRI